MSKYATQDEIKALLLAFYDFKIATGGLSKPQDKVLLASFKPLDKDNASIKSSCDTIVMADCSESLKDSASCIMRMFQ
jgi:hypothetical protein